MSLFSSKGPSAKGTQKGNKFVGLTVSPLRISEVVLVGAAKHSDARGFFSETYSKADLCALGIEIEFVQDNHALSVQRGTVRGLHFQTPPYAQDKLIRVARGAIFDVAVDLRTGSPTFGQHVSAVISSDAWNQILVPVGFAHGFATLEPNTEVIYKVSSHYSPGHDKGLFWEDPALGIDWPVTSSEVVLSDKDKCQPMLSELPRYFFYEGAGSQS